MSQKRTIKHVSGEIRSDFISSLETSALKVLSVKILRATVAQLLENWELYFWEEDPSPHAFPEMQETFPVFHLMQVLK